MIKLVICADYFTEVQGGAEKTFEVLANSLIKEYDLSSEDVLKINTSEIDKDFITKYKDCTWLIGNYYFLISKNIIECFNQIRYFVVEFDYKICPTRNFEIFENKFGYKYEYCSYSRVIDEFLARAEICFFMSEKQKNRHLEFCKELSEKKCQVAGSCFDDKTLRKISSLRKKRESGEIKIDNITAIYGQPTWQKGSGNSVFWCESNNKKYKTLFDMEYFKLLEEMAKCERLVFLPNGADTAPRIVIEAKLLGLEVITNSLVENAEDDWLLSDDAKSIERYLRNQPTAFAKKIKL